MNHSVPTSQEECTKELNAALERAAFLTRLLESGVPVKEDELSLSKAWQFGAATAWRYKGILHYGSSYEVLPENGFIPFSLAQKNPYAKENDATAGLL